MRFIVASSLRFRYLVVAGAVALMFFGVQTLGHQKVDVFPEFAPITVEIQTECLGLSPSEVEQLVTVPLENALQGVPGVYETDSESVPQLSAIFLYFKNGTDVLQARQLVQERLSQAASTLPSWASPPSLYPIVSATSRVMQIGLTSKTVNPLDLSTIALYTIRARLLHVPGVANVAMWGEKKKEIQVQGDPKRMLSNKVSINQLMDAADNAVDAGLLSFTTGSAIGTGGFIETPNQRLNVRNVQVITTARQLAAVPLARRGSRTLTIGDVARVEYGNPPLIGNAVVNGGRGLMLVVEKFPGANTLQVTNGIDKALAALAPGLPGIHIDSHIFRQASFIHTAIANLGSAVLLGCILVVFVLIAFLFEWRAALVSLLAIPLSLAAAGIVLDMTGATINTMILAGFGGGRGGGRRRRDHRHGEHRPAPAHLAHQGAAHDPAQPAPGRLAGGAHGDPVCDADQHRRRHPRGVRRRPDRRVLPAPGDRLRAGRARLDGDRAHGHAGIGDDPDAERASEATRSAADAYLQARLPGHAGASAAGARGGAGRRGTGHRGGGGRTATPRRGPVPDLQGAGPADALRYQARDLAARDDADGHRAPEAPAADPGRDPRGRAYRAGAPGRGDRRARILRAVDHARARTPTWPRPPPQCARSAAPSRARSWT